MSIKNILINNHQYKTLFQENINNDLNIQLLWKKSNESKIFYNASKNPTILLKVRNLNHVDFYSISSELKAFAFINNLCPNIVKYKKSFICDQNSNSYEMNTNSIIKLCRKNLNKKTIPLSILALEYVNGVSLNSINLNIEEFKDVIIQLYCVFFNLTAFQMEITDTNLDNIIYNNINESLDYRYLFGEKGIITIKHKIIVIDMDHVRFGINIKPNIKSIETYIFNKDNYFFKFFNKLFDRNKDIKIFISKLRNHLFDDFNSNIIKKHPLEIIKLIHDFV